MLLALLISLQAILTIVAFAAVFLDVTQRSGALRDIQKTAAKETILIRTSWTTYRFFQPVKGAQKRAVLSKTSYSLQT